MGMEVYFRTSKGSVFFKIYKTPEEASKDIEKETARLEEIGLEIISVTWKESK